MTAGDTIYITEAEKTFYSQPIHSGFENDSKEDEGQQQTDNQHSHRQRQIHLRDNSHFHSTTQEGSIETSTKIRDPSSTISNEIASPFLKPTNNRASPSPLEKYQIDLPTISLESYPHMNESKEKEQNLKSTSSTSTSNSLPFHDPLLNPPPNKVNEWPCGLMILVPLRLGLDRIDPNYFDV